MNIVKLHDAILQSFDFVSAALDCGKIKAVNRPVCFLLHELKSSCLCICFCSSGDSNELQCILTSNSFSFINRLLKV